MDWKVFWTVFGTVFLAELGDKTQLATLMFSSQTTASRWGVFAAAALALTATSALGVAGGAVLGRWLSPRPLGVIAGTAFLLIGGWTLYKSLAG